MSGNNKFLSDDVHKSTTLEDMYKALLMGSDDAPSSFGNFGFSSDEEEPVGNNVTASVRLPSVNQPKEEPIRDVVLNDLHTSRISVSKVEPIDTKDQSDESSSMEDDDEDDESDEEEESETGDEYEEIEVSQAIELPDNDAEVNIDNPAIVVYDDVDCEHKPGVISDEELDAILDLDDDLAMPTVPEESPVAIAAEVDIKASVTLDTPRIGHTEHNGVNETSTMAAATHGTPVNEIPPRNNPGNNGDYVICDIETNHKIVNGIPVNTVDSAEEETASSVSTDEEKPHIPEEKVIIVSTYSSNGEKPKLNSDNTLVIEKKKPVPVKTTATRAYEWHNKLRNDTSYRCCVLCIILFCSLTLAAFIIALVAVTNRCECKDTDLLRSQLLILMEERNCPAGWRTYKGSCYGMVGNTKKSYKNAQTACRFYGADVVTLETNAENDFFSKNILCPRYSYMQRNDPVYIGLKKVNIGNNTSIRYKYTWSSNEVYSFSNSLQTTNSTKLCVQITKNGKWTEVDCSTQIHFYCEQKLIKNPTC